TRTFGRELQINNSNQVAVEDTLTGSTIFRKARIWDSTTTGSFTDIANGASPLPTFDFSSFDAIGAFTSMSNDGRLAFAGLLGSNWEINTSNVFVDRDDLSKEVATLSSSTFFRQMAADRDQVVIGTRQSTTKRILLGDPSRLTVLATTA